MANQNLLESVSQQETMSTLQIAELTGKRHDAVLRDVRVLISQGVNLHNFVETSYKDKIGREFPCYNLTKKGCMILASGYDALLREKIIDRWETLENEKRMGSYGAMIPTTFSEALILAGNLQKKVEENALLIAEQNETITKQADKIRQDAPKVLFTDAVSASKSSCLVGELAKLITQNGYQIGEKRLFAWLRDNKYLGKHGERYNIPNQQYVEQGLFELKKGTRSGNGGVMHTTITTKITANGQVYFVNKFLNAFAS